MPTWCWVRGVLIAVRVGHRGIREAETKGVAQQRRALGMGSAMVGVAHRAW